MYLLNDKIKIIHSIIHPTVSNLTFLKFAIDLITVVIGCIITLYMKLWVFLGMSGLLLSKKVIMLLLTNLNQIASIL